jgi:hypothetical protein
MDPDLRLAGAPAQPQAVLDLLRRARELSEPEVQALARSYRHGDRVAQLATDEDGDPVDRRRRRARALSLAIARSGGRREARQLEATCHAAVRMALAGSPALRPLTRLGIVDDAAAAVTDAALAILVRDRLGAALRRELSAAWIAVTDRPELITGSGR